MFTTAHTPIRNTLTAVAATFVCTLGTLAAIDSPAHAATTRSFVSVVESQLNRGNAPTGDSGIATVAVRVDGAGQVIRADLIASTRHAALDRDALRIARSVAYPKGDRTRVVAVVLKYGDADLPTRAQSAALVSRYIDAQGRALATQALAPNAG